MVVRPELEEFVSVPEGRIHFVKKGSGPPLVLLHALGSSTRTWDAVMDPLGQHFSCYAFDMLGHGQSEKPATDLSMPDFARATANAMREIGIDRAHVVANSVGAVVAVELAASYPDRVDRLVLVGCPARDIRTAPQSIKNLDAGYDEKGMPRPRTLEDTKAITWFINPKPEWVQRSNEDWAQCGLWARKTMEALLWYDILPRLPLVKATATLLLLGEHDQWRKDEDLLRYNLPNASKMIVPGVGHAFQIEAPEAFVGAVLDFLKG